MKILNLFEINFNKIVKKIDAPSVYAIIKITDIGKDSGIYDDENKIIELHEYGETRNIKYSEADVDSFRKQGIPVIDEEYNDDYDFLEIEEINSVESWER